MSGGCDCTRQGEIHVISLVFCPFVWLACLSWGCRFGKNRCTCLTNPENRGILKTFPADVVKLADTIDLGSIASACRFKSCRPHQNKTLRNDANALFLSVSLFFSRRLSFICPLCRQFVRIRRNRAQKQ